MSGVMDADNEGALRAKLREKDYHVVFVAAKKKGLLENAKWQQAAAASGQEGAQAGGAMAMLASFRKAKAKSVVVFSRQFSTMISAGLSLVRALDILEKQTDDKKLAEVIGDIRHKVEEGSSLAEAFASHPQTFSELYINLTRAGEIGGVLDETMARVAEFLEKDMTLKAKVKSAMTYPAVVFIIAITITLFLLIFVLPTFKSMFEGLGAKLPAITAFVVSLSNAIRNYWYIWIGTIVAVVIVFKKYTATPRGMFQLHTVQLNLPVFGMLNRKVTVSRFSRTLGTLLSSGVPVMQALEVTGKASGNKVVEKAVESVRASIREGESISIPMEASGIFPPMVTQMIAVGEETGSLDSMLKKISDFYDMEVEATLDSLTSLLEPLLMVFMGVMVGFLVVAMYMPLFVIVNEI